MNVAKAIESCKCLVTNINETVATTEKDF